MELAENDPEIKKYLDSNDGFITAAFLSHQVTFAITMQFEGYRKGLDFFFNNDLQIGSMQVKNIKKIVKDAAITKLEDLKKSNRTKSIRIALECPEGQHDPLLNKSLFFSIGSSVGHEKKRAPGGTLDYMKTLTGVVYME
jgi:hypothetical protein